MSTETGAYAVSKGSLNMSIVHGSSFRVSRSSSRMLSGCTACLIGADRLELIYWKPEDTTTGPLNASITAAPYTTMSDGYTFTSPSVYVVYTRLGAYEDCYSGLYSNLYTNGSYVNGSWSYGLHVGSMYSKVTRAYEPEALSTGGDCYNTNWAAINYSKLYNPEPDYQVVTEPTCSKYHISKGETIDSAYWLAGDPLLSMPQDLLLVDPLWSTCTVEGAGGYDPPRILSSVTALIPSPATTRDPPTQAQPASSPTHSLPAQTAASEPVASSKDQPSGDDIEIDPSSPTDAQIAEAERAHTGTLKPDTNPDPLDTGDHRQERASAAPSLQQGAEYDEPPSDYPQRVTDIQDGGSSQAAGQAKQGQQSNSVAAEPQQDGGNESADLARRRQPSAPDAADPEQDLGSDSQSDADSHQESDIEEQDPPVDDAIQADGHWTASAVVGTHTILADASGIRFDGVPLDSQGSPVTVSSAAVMRQGSSIIVGDSIVHRPPSSVADGSTLFAGLAVTPLADAVAIGGQTLHPGDPARTIAGTLISFDKNDNLILKPTTVQILPVTPAPALRTLANGETTAIDGQKIRVLLSSGISALGKPLRPEGSAATVSVSGTRTSLGKSSSVIDGHTIIPISFPSPSLLLTTTIGDQVIINAPSSLVLQGTTLKPGAAGVTRYGNNQLISLDAGSLIVGSRTIALGDSTPLITRIGEEMITAARRGVEIVAATLLPGVGAAWTVYGMRVSLDDKSGVVIFSEETIKLDGGSIGRLTLAHMGTATITNPSPAAAAAGSRASGMVMVGSAVAEGKTSEGGAYRLDAVGLWMTATYLTMVAMAYLV